MKASRFIVAWLFTSIIMFVMFYWWHGVFLNDFAAVAFPLEQYLRLAVIVYLSLGLVIYGLIAFLDFTIGPAKKGVLIGTVMGFLIYLVAFFFGVSFHNTAEPEHLMLDFIWQMAEQGFGGLLCGAIYSFFTVQIELRAKAFSD